MNIKQGWSQHVSHTHYCSGCLIYVWGQLNTDTICMCKQLSGASIMKTIQCILYSVRAYVQAVYCWGTAGLLGSWWTPQHPKCENNACGNSPFHLLAGGLLPPSAASYEINKREKDSSWRELINAGEVEEMATQVAEAGTAMEEWVKGGSSWLERLVADGWGDRLRWIWGRYLFWSYFPAFGNTKKC